ncbi:MAG: septal ring lytic transglycosylase RlpA family protein [Caulobacteraceae bacterium]|nr:septal ring lytic transglycosylase RlpA family protein [Caulobacteraceae bacterium]
MAAQILDSEFNLDERAWRIVRASAVLSLAALGLAACATAPKPSVGPTATNVRPPTTGLRGTEKPYQVDGVWYYPHTDPNYDAVGTASWYGQKFHNHQTADGEIFDQNGLSAAHTTLPLPSVVEVTNLDNGKKLKLRVNDRGPFVGGRVLDVSRAAAEQLGFERQGTARVRVRYVGPAPAFSTPVMLAAIDPASPPRRWAASPSQPSRLDGADIDRPTARNSGVVSAASLAPVASSAAGTRAPMLLALAESTPASRFTEPAVRLSFTAPQSAQSAQTYRVQTYRVQTYRVQDEDLGPAPLSARTVAPPTPVGVSSLGGQALAPAQSAPATAEGPVDAYVVQAGAFSSRDIAERAAARLGDAGSTAIRPLARNGMTLYRVVLRGYPDAGAAEVGRARAAAAGFSDARVIAAF